VLMTLSLNKCWRRSVLTRFLPYNVWYGKNYGMVWLPDSEKKIDRPRPTARRQVALLHSIARQKLLLEYFCLIHCRSTGKSYKRLSKKSIDVVKCREAEADCSVQLDWPHSIACMLPTKCVVERSWDR